MFAPQLYTVRKFPLTYLIDHNFDIQIDKSEEEKYYIKQQDNQLFRQIRLITKNKSKYNKYFVFVDCKGGQSHKDEIEKLVLNGFKLIGSDFDDSERSASMTRTQILSFVDSTISDELDERISMGIKLEKTVLAKLYAYRGLMLSGCHCIENWYPKVIIVPDYYRIIANQKIKYVYDKEIEFTDKEGKQRTWQQKDIAEDIRDITINVFDGCGIHHPDISKLVKEKLKSKTDLTSILWRMPYIKGVTHEVDYVKFFEERGVKEIVDVWGDKHNIYSEPMIIMTESMYKGKKYFQKFKDGRDWDEYWNKFKQYDHCVGVAKWNFSLEEEPKYTRSSYQILQDLDLSYEDFSLLAKDSIDWATKIVNGDSFYTYCFLGLFADHIKPLNSYCKAILKNPEMLKEYGVRKYLINLITKYIDEFKCGKLWLNACFKILTPDLIMLLEWIAGDKNPNGCLNSDQFYSLDIDGIYDGEYLIERNPHICKSEHTILNATSNSLIKVYCGNLVNICMINGKSITPQRLNGADYDGDLVLVINNELMKSGVKRDIAVVIDVDDKITGEEEEPNKENKAKIVLRTLNSLIGETSNCATGYHNKVPKTPEQKIKYESFIDLLSVINGKSIDYAKTGVLYNIPRHIAKYSKPFPYFMKYAGEYYSNQTKFSRSPSNMNRLCWEIEKWNKSFKYKHSYRDFDYTIMIDDSIDIDQNTVDKIETVYLEFCKEMADLSKLQYKLRNYKKFQAELKNIITYKTAKQTEIYWKHYYNLYKTMCNEVCNDQKMLANIVVRLCYEKYPNRNTYKKFIWVVAEEGIVQNIKQVPIKLPIRTLNGDYEYLGKQYDIIDVNLEDINID